VSGVSELSEVTIFSLDLGEFVAKGEVESSRLGPVAYWEQADETYRQMTASRLEWMKMSTRDQQELKVLVKRSLTKLSEEVDDWLPDSISMDRLGDHLSVTIHFQVGDVSKEGDILEMQFESDARELLAEINQVTSTLE